MEKFILVKPTIKEKELAIDYVKEFGNEYVNGSGGLKEYIDAGKSYDEWLKRLEEKEKDIVTEKSVPSVTFFLMNSSKTYIFGTVNIRLALNERLRNTNGNIGYSIRPKERRKGYAKIILYLALKVCDMYNMDRVMLDCDIENIASKKTILSLGGVKEKEMYNDDFCCMVEVYYIDVKDSIIKYSNEYEKYIEEKYIE